MEKGKEKTRCEEKKTKNGIHHTPCIKLCKKIFFKQTLIVSRKRDSSELGKNNQIFRND